MLAHIKTPTSFYSRAFEKPKTEEEGVFQVWLKAPLNHIPTDQKSPDPSGAPPQGVVRFPADNGPD